MYSLILVASLLGGTTACNDAASTAAAKDGYDISGQLKNAPAGAKIYLAELNGQQLIGRDTAALDAQGRFTMKGSVPEAGLYQLKLDEQNQVLLVVDNKTKLQLTGDAQKLAENYSVKGSPDSEMLQKVLGSLSKARAYGSSLEQRYQAHAAAGRQDSMQAIEKQFYAFQNRSIGAVKNQVRKNPGSIASAFIVTNMINPDENFGLADTVATSLQKAYPNSRYTKELAAKLEPLRKTAVGTTAPDINLTTPDGKTVALSSLRGKYVLIDFWASWCGPCRQENPNVVRTYNKYKGKNFDIYGVSLDQDKGKWQKAIDADGLTWTHVSDLKGWQSAAGAAYGVQAIPMNFLLDPQGKIIAKNLRGEALDAELARRLK